MIIKNIRNKQHIIRFQSKQKKYNKQIFCLISLFIMKFKKSILKIDNSKVYFMCIKIHENFEHDKNFNVEKFIDLFKCENKQLNQIVRFFRQIFRKFLFDVLFSKRQNEHTINIKNAKSININVYSMFHLQFEK